MTVRTAFAGSVSRQAPDAPAATLPAWLHRIGLAPAANDASGPCLRVIVGRSERPAPVLPRRCGTCTTIVVTGSRLDVVA
jgi:hypothetical protein